MTFGFSNLSIRSEYHGPDQLQLGNGAGLPISHVGMSSFSVGSLTFKPKDIFHIPNISKNLLSVSKFTHDNDVIFEFHPDFFLVKDRRTGKVVLQGPNKQGLYRLNKSSHVNLSSPSAYIGERTSMNLWHQRLGHPMMRTLKEVVAAHSLPIHNKKLAFCRS